MSSASVPPRVIPLPRIVNAPAGFRIVMPPKIVPTGKSLFGLVRTLPPNNSESFAAMLSPPQFAGVLQKSFPPPPVHVRSAASTWEGTSTGTRRSATEARRLALNFIGKRVARCSVRLTLQQNTFGVPQSCQTFGGHIGRAVLLSAALPNQCSGTPACGNSGSQTRTGHAQVEDIQCATCLPCASRPAVCRFWCVSW